MCNPPDSFYGLFVGVFWEVTMKLYPFIQDNIFYTFTSMQELIQHPEEVKNKGINIIVSYADYDCRIIWKVKQIAGLRHYMYTVSNFPEPNAWEMYEFNLFLDYENKYGRKILLSFSNEQHFNYFKKSIESWFLYNHKTKVMRPFKLTHCKACIEGGCLTDLFCHTTSIDYAKKILESGFLLSPVKARKTEKISLVNEDRNAAGDPEDYFDYIMLSYGNCIAGDRLVIERRLGRQPENKDLSENFVPGVRFYFTTDLIEKHNKFCNDGYHPGKVKDSIDLEKYLLLVIAPEIAKEYLKDKIILAERIIYMDHTKSKDIFDWTSKAYNIARERL